MSFLLNDSIISVFLKVLTLGMSDIIGFLILLAIKGFKNNIRKYWYQEKYDFYLIEKS